jgi:hypothetical protein
LSGDHSWTTEEGAVVLAIRGDTLLVTESLDPVITEQFRTAVLNSQATPTAPAEVH